MVREFVEYTQLQTAESEKDQLFSHQTKHLIRVTFH